MKVSVRIIVWQAMMVSGSVICLPRGSFAQADNQIEQYIQTYQSVAEEEMIRTGVPAAISLAQGIIESQAGTGWLAVHANNQFGIKCKAGWTGPTVLHNDDAPNECFRAYANADSSWRDHSDFLRSSSRYSFLFSLDPLNYKAWANGLKKAGYATSKTYAQELIHTIQKWGLEQYSEQAYAQMNDGHKNAFAAMLDKKVEEDRRAMGIPSPKPVQTSKPAQKTGSISSYPSGIFRINGRKVLYLPSGTQLISIAEKYHIKLSRLVRFNELNSDVIDKNMLIYLQKKKKSGANKTHTVNGGETLHEIAQEEGIRLKWLRKRNRLRSQGTLKRGEVLYLRGYAPKIIHSPANNPEDQPSLLGKDRGIDSLSDRPLVKTTSESQHPSAQSSLQYKVKEGDTLYSISKRYNVTVEQIQQWNHIDGTTIKTGQNLLIYKK